MLPVPQLVPDAWPGTLDLVLARLAVCYLTWSLRFSTSGLSHAVCAASR